MKKYLLGIVAVMLAVGFSAFQNVPANKINKTKELPQPTLYWYQIESDGSLGSALNGGATMTKNTAKGYTSCTDVTSTDCDRGYTTAQTVGTDPAASTDSNSDYHIIKTN